MTPSSPIARLTVIVEAIALIRAEMADVSVDDFEPDKRKRWIVERGIEIISEASRRLPDAMKARHTDIPWKKVAGIGNILRHDYEHVAHDVLWHAVLQHLPPLEKACRDELTTEQERERRSPE